MSDSELKPSEHDACMSISNLSTIVKIKRVEVFTEELQEFPILDGVLCSAHI